MNMLIYSFLSRDSIYDTWANSRAFYCLNLIIRFQLLKCEVLIFFFIWNYFELSMFEFWIIGQTRRYIWWRHLWLTEPVMDIFHTFLMLYTHSFLSQLDLVLIMVTTSGMPRHFTRHGVFHGVSFIDEGLECDLIEWIHCYYCSAHLANASKAFKVPFFNITSSTKHRKNHIELFP